MSKPFILHGSRTVLQTPIFDVREDDATNPTTGHRGRYVVLENPNWVHVIACTPEDDVLFVRQWRHGTRALELEFPAGLVDPGENALEAIQRELFEETGFVSESWTHLGDAHPNVAYQQNICATFLAKNCIQKSIPTFSHGESIELVRVPRAEIMGLVRQGVIHSAVGLTGLFWWAMHGGVELGPDA